MDEITWEEMVEIEPRLLRLQKEIEKVKDEGGEFFCANMIWYGYGGHPGFKPYMNRLVGHVSESENPRMRTVQAHSIAYKKLYGPLPPCRNCGCLP